MENADLRSGTSLIEMKKSTFIQGSWKFEKAKIISPVCSIYGNITSNSEIVLNCGEVTCESNAIVTSRRAINMISVSLFINKGKITAQDITGWFESPITNICKFINNGSVELNEFTIMNRNEKSTSQFYHIQIYNNENSIWQVKGVTKIIANMKNSRITLNNNGKFLFKGDFKKILETVLGEIYIHNQCYMECLSNFYLIGSVFQNERDFIVRGKTKFVVKSLTLSGQVTFKNDVIFICDNCNFEGAGSEIKFEKDVVFNVFGDMSTLSHVTINGCLTINMSSSQQFNNLSMNNTMIVGKNFLITAPNILTDDLSMKQLESGANNRINALNSKFHGNLKCKGNIDFKIKKTADFNSSIHASISEFSIGQMTGDLRLSGEESTFSVDELLGNITMRMTKQATLVVNKEASKSSNVDIEAKKIVMINKGKQDGKKVKLTSTEDILTKFCFDMSSQMDIHSSTGNVTHIVNGSVKNQQNVKGKKVIFICGDLIEAPSKIIADTQASAIITGGVSSNMDITGENVNYVNKGNQSSSVNIKSTDKSDVYVKGNVSGDLNVNTKDSIVSIDGNHSGRMNVKAQELSRMNIGNVTETASITSNSRTGSLSTNNFAAKNAELKSTDFMLNANAVRNTGKLTGGQSLTINANDIKNSGSISAKSLTLEGTSVYSSGSIKAKDSLNLNSTNTSLLSSTTEGKFVTIKGNSLSLGKDALLYGKEGGSITSNDIKNEGFIKTGNNSTLQVNSTSFKQLNKLEGGTVFINSKTMINDGEMKLQKGVKINSENVLLKDKSNITGEQTIIQSKNFSDTSKSKINSEYLKIEKDGKTNVKSQVNATLVDLKSDDYDLCDMKNIKSRNISVDISNASKNIDRNLDIDPNVECLEVKVKDFTNSSKISGNISVDASRDIINKGSISGKNVSLVAKGDVNLSSGQLYGSNLEQVIAGKRIVLPPKKKQKETFSSFWFGTTSTETVERVEFKNRKDMIYKAGKGDLDFSSADINVSGRAIFEASNGNLSVKGSNITAGENIVLKGSKGVDASSESGVKQSGFFNTQTKKKTEQASINSLNGSVEITSSEGMIDIQGSSLKSEKDLKVYGKNGVNANSREGETNRYWFTFEQSKEKLQTKLSSNSGNVEILSESGNINAKHVDINAKGQVNIISVEGDVDLSYQKHYLGRKPEFDVSTIKGSNVNIEGKRVNISTANINSKEGGHIIAEDDIIADSVIETYVARSWSSSSWFGFRKSYGYEEDAVMAKTTIKTEGKFTIKSEKGGVSAKGLQVQNMEGKQATDLEVIAEKDINLDSIQQRVHHSSSSSSWWGLNQKRTSGYNTQGAVATVQASDSILVHSKSGSITGRGVNLIASDVELHAKKGIDLKPLEVETYSVTKESGFSFSFGNPPSLYNNVRQVARSVSSLVEGQDGPTGCISDVVGAGMAGYNTFVNIAQLALSNPTMLLDQALKCISPSIGFYSKESSFYQKEQVLGNIICNNFKVKVDDPDGKASFASNIQARRSTIDVKNLEFSNAQKLTKTTSRSTQIGVELGIGSLITGSGLPITVSGSHHQSKSSEISNTQAKINLGDTTFVQETTMHNKGNLVTMEKVSGKKVKIIDEHMQDHQESSSSGGDFSISFSVDKLSSASIGAHHDEHEHRITSSQGKAKTIIQNSTNEVEHTTIEKKDYHHDVGIGFHYSHSFEKDSGPEISMPLKVYGQIGETKFRIELPPLDIAERFKKGGNIIVNAINFDAERDAPNKIFKFDSKKDEKQADTELRMKLVNGIPYEQAIVEIQNAYNVLTFEQDAHLKKVQKEAERTKSKYEKPFTTETAKKKVTKLKVTIDQEVENLLREKLTPEQRKAIDIVQQMAKECISGPDPGSSGTDDPPPPPPERNIIDNTARLLIVGCGKFLIGIDQLCSSLPEGMVSSVKWAVEKLDVAAKCIDSCAKILEYGNAMLQGARLGAVGGPLGMLVGAAAGAGFVYAKDKILETANEKVKVYVDDVLGENFDSNQVATIRKVSSGITSVYNLKSLRVKNFKGMKKSAIGMYEKSKVALVETTIKSNSRNFLLKEKTPLEQALSNFKTDQTIPKSYQN